jgi:hypothetical protein
MESDKQRKRRTPLSLSIRRNWNRLECRLVVDSGLLDFVKSIPERIVKVELVQRRSSR